MLRLEESPTLVQDDAPRTPVVATGSIEVVGKIIDGQFFPVAVYFHVRTHEAEVLMRSWLEVRVGVRTI
jgi:hypothetical protein